MAWEVALILGFVGAAIALFYISSSFEKSHYVLQLLFMFVGLFLILATFGLNDSIIRANNSTINNTNTTHGLTQVTSAVYDGFIWVTVFVLIYFILYFIVKVVKSMRERKYGEE